MATGSRFSFADMQNPLFLHPSDGPMSVSVAKLQGAEDYRTWRRSIEIQLASKRKLGFVTGTEARSTTDATDALQWDTCNNMVISWLHNNICDSIKKSILFINSAADVWKLLEQRFQLTNGSRKYKLNKDLFSIKQNGSTLVEYYTSISTIWEEIDAMNVLPVIGTLTGEVTEFLTALEVQKQELRLFQFLNGLDESYASQRSQILMSIPLPTVAMACSVIQQEESQKAALSDNQVHESVAMYSKVHNSADKNVGGCPECGRKGHGREDCWRLIGYPKWHSKHKRVGNSSQRGGIAFGSSGNWNQNRSNKMANVAQSCDQSQENETVDDNIVLTTRQLEQILKMLPVKNYRGDSKSEEDFDAPFSGMASFSGMVLCNNVQSSSNEWIVDSGATDHMTSTLSLLSNVKKASSQCTIKLPTGDNVQISHTGDLQLENGLKLLGVLYVPEFNHNLLSIRKLAQDNECHVMFLPDKCVIQNTLLNTVQGIGVLKNGLYYLNNSTDTVCNNSSYGATECQNSKETYETWHNRLGHAPAAKIRLIPQLKAKVDYEKNKVC